eukprot:7551033-Pyramimonas_sp.AAC.1
MPRGSTWSQGSGLAIGRAAVGDGGPLQGQRLQVNDVEVADGYEDTVAFAILRPAGPVHPAALDGGKGGLRG